MSKGALQCYGEAPGAESGLPRKPSGLLTRTGAHLTLLPFSRQARAW